MTKILIARILAIAVCAPLAAILIFDAEYRSDNIFAIPDALGCAVLLVSAVLPARRAVLPFTIGFGYMGGVITVAAFERLDVGEVFNATLDFAIAAVFLLLSTAFVRSFMRGAH